MTIKIEDLDEFEGLTADMVRAWLRKEGWREEPRGGWMPPGRQIEGGLRVCCMADVITPTDGIPEMLTAIQHYTKRSIQSLLREINPRMRAGLPTKAEMDAHPGFWIGHMGGKYPAPTIGYFMRLIGGFEWRSGNAVWDMVALERAAQSEYPCAFWPCDQHGNKTRRGA